MLVPAAATSGDAVHGLGGPDWHPEPVGFDGRHKWICQSPGCGGNAAVAYAPQIFNAVFSLLDYEAQWKSRAKSPKGIPQAVTKRGLFRRIRSADETDGDLRHYTLVMQRREPNGAIDFVAAGYMARGVQAYELLSDALTSETAEANLKLLAAEVTHRFDPR